jgi:Protein of unknown function (DUF4231)
MDTTNYSTTMTQEEYLKNRIDTQIKWYEDKSAINKNWYYRCHVLMLVCSALIPLLIGFSNAPYEYFKYIAGSLGVVVAIMQGILGLKKYQENWITYRSTSEMLQREKLLFLNGIGDFEDRNYAFKVFVLKAEQIMSSENSNWITLQGSNEKQKEV